MSGGMRSVGSVVISFGLVRIPVKLYLTAGAVSVSFKLLTPDGHQVKQKWVDGETGEEVEYEDLHRGKEVSKGEFVSFTKEELDNLAEDKSDTVDLTELVPRAAIDLSPMAVEKVCYVGPGDGGDRAYRLFLTALVRSEKVAVAKYYARGKDHLVALCPTHDQQLILMYQLYYEAERRTFTPNFTRGSDPTDKEIKLAHALIKQLTRGDFILSSYQDEYGARVSAAVERKRAGIKAPTRGKAGATKPIDLEDLLEGSLRREKK